MWAGAGSNYQVIALTEFLQVALPQQLEPFLLETDEQDPLFARAEPRLQKGAARQTGLVEVFDEFRPIDSLGLKHCEPLVDLPLDRLDDVIAVGEAGCSAE